VPSERCPQCDASLSGHDAPASGTCPACDPPVDGRDAASVRPPDLEAVGEGDDSVRPPDLVPDSVRDGVLDGWDVGVGPDELARWSEDRRPFPTDTVVVAGGAAAGAAVGLLIGERPSRDVALGALAGGLGAATLRRVWRLEH
jgi:hypothetical protein